MVVRSGKNFYERLFWAAYLFVYKLRHNSLHVFDNRGKKLSHKKIQYTFGTKLFTRIAKPIRIIGDPDNQRPEKWSSTVFLLLIRTSGISLGT
jgi:hypothetical protein